MLVQIAGTTYHLHHEPPQSQSLIDATFFDVAETGWLWSRLLRCVCRLHHFCCKRRLFSSFYYWRYSISYVYYYCRCCCPYCWNCYFYCFTWIIVACCFCDICPDYKIFNVDTSDHVIFCCCYNKTHFIFYFVVMYCNYYIVLNTCRLS